jgi:uncharacterized membrane protein
MTVLFFLIGFGLIIWMFSKISQLEDEFRLKISSLEAKLRRLEEFLGKEKPKKALKIEEEEMEDKPVVPPPLPRGSRSLDLDIPPIKIKPTPKAISEPERKPAPKIESPQAPSRKSEFEKKWEHFIQNVDWEQFTGVKLFAWLGGVALFCGAAFFVKYSIDRNLIPPALRLAVGALIGIGLILWSLRMDRKKYETTSHILSAGGVGVLYTVVFATTHLYHYLPNIAGLVLLALISASAFVLAIFLEGISISALGALGAYAAPVLLSTGEANLAALFVYLAVVNAGIFEVVRRLKSAGLFLLSVLGTLVLLSLGTWGTHPAPEVFAVTGIALANLALFSLFLYRMPPALSKSQAVLAGGYALFLGLLGLAFVLLGQPGFYPLALVTAGIVAAVFLAFQREEWAGAVIPYNIATFVVALLWTLVSFKAKDPSWDFLLFFLYGLAGGLGPIVLVRKYGLPSSYLSWFKVFPAVSFLLTLFILLKNPETSIWFWPMVLGLHLVGMFICFLVGSVLELAALAVLVLVNGLLWITRSPLLVVGLGFYLFLLGAGILLCVAAALFLKKLPDWLSSPALKPFEGRFKQMDKMAAEWMAAFPALGAFLLLGTAFLIQTPLQPDAGMATGLCFLAIALFLGKRISSAPLLMTALMAFALAQTCWMLRLTPKEPLNLEMLYWSGFLWLGALVLPFLFFRPAEKQKQTWQAWALFELVQALYFLKAADSLWLRDFMGWFPLGLFLLKVPAVKNLLNRLVGKAERNSILAFHGGVLLFYLSCLPVLLLDNGWLGLTLVFESMALLWLNRRIEHPGLPWVSTLMAPAGLAFLISNLHHLKAPGSAPILNWAVGSVALAVVALSLAARLAPEAKSKNAPIPFPAYFLWLAIGSGFFLLNLMIADWFGGQGTGGGLSFQFLSQDNLTQFISYSLLWALFGAVMWRVGALPKSLRFVGLILLSAAWLRVVIMPYLFPAGMIHLRPFLNLASLAYLGLLAVLSFLVMKQKEEKDWGDMKPFFIGLLAVLGLLALHLEGGFFLQPEDPISLVFRHNFSMALASAFGWVAYGLAVYLWPKVLDKPFRLAGVALAAMGFLKMIFFPFRYPETFGNLTPVLNLPNLVYLAFIGALLFLNLKDPKDRWPLETLPARWFWGTIMCLFSFFVLNVEVVQLFGVQGHPFTFSTDERFSQQLAYSLSWLLFAMGLLWVGIKWASVAVRWAALSLFFVTTLKIFFMDLWNLGQLYRVASFIGLAVVLILVSFLYQRFLTTGKKK